MSAGTELGAARSAGTELGAARIPRAPAATALVKARRLTTAAVAVAALVPLAAYLWVAAHDLGYPYELDWMEGGSVGLAGRVLSGHSLYVAPSLRFVGWAYPPLYYWLAAAVAKLTGLGFLPLRLVSAGSALAAMATLAWIVLRDTRDRLAALVAAGLFAATYRLSGAWFDVGRVDSLFLALTLVAMAWGCRARGVRGGAVLGLLTFLAFFTKQTALVAIAPALAYLIVTRRRVGVTAVITAVVLVLGSTLLLDALTAGWYRYYAFSELAGQPWMSQLWVGFWGRDVLAHQWPLALLLALAFASWARERAKPRVGWPAGYWLAAAAGLLGAAWVSRLHTGGYLNVLMPTYAATALLAGLALASVRRRGGATAALAGALVIAQVAILGSWLGTEVPSARDRAAGAALLARLRRLPGPVLVLRHPWYATELGKGTFAQDEAIGDVLRSEARRGARALRASLATALDVDRVRAVVLDGGFDAELLGGELQAQFRLQPQPLTRSPLYPLTDTQTAPRLLYLRIRPPGRRAPRS
ncbi:MAG: glycosyltransferase family 39 protein [Solirubrobacterales bacterium]|nr:glycosyltransferase family 39 protein [Solirubrobacterales bacterium]